MDERVDILLVEDNPNDVELTLRALKKAKIEGKVLVVQDGAEALEFLFCTGKYIARRIEELPKVTFLDLNLPKVDGLEVLGRIKTDPRTSVMPVVMLTSSREERHIIASYKMGANSYVVKPVDCDKLEQAVSRVGVYWMQLNEQATPPSTVGEFLTAAASHRTK